MVCVKGGRFLKIAGIVGDLSRETKCYCVQADVNVMNRASNRKLLLVVVCWVHKRGILSKSSLKKIKHTTGQFSHHSMMIHNEMK